MYWLLQSNIKTEIDQKGSKDTTNYERKQFPRYSIRLCLTLISEKTLNFGTENCIKNQNIYTAEDFVHS